MKSNFTISSTEFFKDILGNGDFVHLNPMDNGNLSVSYITWNTIFDSRQANGVSSTFVQFEKNRAISTSQTFSGDDVSLMLGDNLTVNNGVSLTIEDDAQFIVVPSTFFVQ